MRSFIGSFRLLIETRIDLSLGLRTGESISLAVAEGNICCAIDNCGKKESGQSDAR